MEKASITKNVNSSVLQAKAPVAVPPERRTEPKPAEVRPAPPRMAPSATAAVPPVLPQKREVKFELYNATARSAFLAGTFNNWNPQATSMKGSGKGKWEAVLALAPGKYEYRFIVDGQWIEDPLAKEQVPNPYSGSNSIITVK